MYTNRMYAVCRRSRRPSGWPVARACAGSARGRRRARTAAPDRARPASRDLWLRHARHRPRLQADQPELVRHDARHQAAVVRQISSARTTAPSPACARAASACKVVDADRAGRARRRRSSSSCSASASTRDRRRSACATRTASSAHSAPARPGARSWIRTCSRTRSSTGDRPAWCSSATCRCAGCRCSGDNSADDRARAPGRERRRGRATRTASSCRTSRARFPLPDITGAYTHSRRAGATSGPPASLRGMNWDDALDDQFDLAGDATGWGINLSSNIKLGKNDVHPAAVRLRRRHRELHERRAGRRRRRQSTPATR